MKISRQQAFDFTILALRWYLAFYMFSYGIGKLTTGQFGLYDPKIAEQPMKDIDPFTSLGICSTTKYSSGRRGWARFWALR